MANNNEDINANGCFRSKTNTDVFPESLVHSKVFPKTPKDKSHSSILSTLSNKFSKKHRKNERLQFLVIVNHDDLYSSYFYKSKKDRIVNKRILY
jgi:hypothetical protein